MKKKLILSRETLRILGDHQMTPVVGASGGGASTCIESCDDAGCSAQTCGSCSCDCGNNTGAPTGCICI